MVSKMSNVFLYLNFLEKFMSNWYYFSLKCLVEFTSKSFWALSFLYEKVLGFLSYLLFFFCAGSSLLCAGYSLVAASRSYSPL